MTSTQSTPKTTTCPRCNGEGYIREYGFVKDGVCFKCNGSGKVAAPRTRKPTAKQQAAREQREARTAAEAAAHQAMVEKAMADPRVWSSPRMRVTKEHPYAYMHAVEVYQWHEKFGWYAS